MDGDMLARLGELQAKVTRFGALAAQLTSAVPRRAAGSDATGHVLVELGSDGLPVSVEIRDGWERHLRAAGLAAAIMQAHGDAVRQGMAEWTNHRRQEQKQEQRAATPSPPAGTAREPGELTEKVLQALRDVQLPAPAQSVDGTDTGAHVTVTLGPAGPLKWSIDTEWAARRDGQSITAAVNQALRAATEATPKRPAPGTDLDGLLGDALATLRAVTRPPKGEIRE